MTTEELREKIRRGDYVAPFYPGGRGQPIPLVKEARRRWRDEDSRLSAQFHADAMEAVGLSQHPNAEKIWAYAYDKGHASGYEEVLTHLEELAEVISTAPF